MVDTDDALAPIVQSLELGVRPVCAFECFTERFAAWWPVLTHSLSRSEATRCRMELHEGGRVLERAPGGEEHLWGTVTCFEPGRRLCFTWHPGREPASAQWVEVRFESLGSGSRVTLTHGGWEALGEIAPILRREYAPGWCYVFGECFGTLAAEQG